METRLKALIRVQKIKDLNVKLKNKEKTFSEKDMLINQLNELKSRIKNIEYDMRNKTFKNNPIIINKLNILNKQKNELEVKIKNE